MNLPQVPRRSSIRGKLFLIDRRTLFQGDLCSEFLSNILPNSDKKPYVLFGSTNFCLQCRQALVVFRALEKQFNDVGIGTAEFNVNDQRLSNELGILNAPSLCVISQHRVYHFDDHGKVSSYSESNIKEFVRKSIPIHRYIQTVSEKSN
jgi:thiol-disulfide isomerase/thioredoxin